MRSIPPMLTTETAVVLLVDLQEKFLPVIQGVDGCIEAAGRLMDCAAVLGLPLVVTEQYPAGLGRTCEPLRSRLGDAPIVEKVRFSACIEPVLDLLRERDRRQILLIGVETHVCVQQTALDLLRLGYDVHVCADAVGSRRRLDHDIALARMRQAGACITTVESAVLEMVGEAGSDLFKSILKIIK